MGKKKEVFNGFAAEQFLGQFIPVSKSQLVTKYDDIRLRAPLVLKIMSDDALHKTDIGGVKIVLEQDEVRDAFIGLVKVAKKHKLKLDGIMVQEYMEGEQLIIGIKKDAVFGHVILFGMGGIFTEVFEDTSTRKCPITLNDAQEMIDELKAKKIFYGFRGKKLDVALIKQVLVAVSKIPTKHKDIEEMDINPFILKAKGGACVDARISFNH